MKSRTVTESLEFVYRIMEQIKELLRREEGTWGAGGGGVSGELQMKTRDTKDHLKGPFEKGSAIQ